VAGLLTSCNNHAPKEAKFIPKDASAVLVMDPKSLHDKLEKSGINMDTLINRLFFKEMQSIQQIELIFMKSKMVLDLIGIQKYFSLLYKTQTKIKQTPPF
jgi:hypothetical protein